MPRLRHPRCARLSRPELESPACVTEITAGFASGAAFLIVPGTSRVSPRRPADELLKLQRRGRPRPVFDTLHDLQAYDERTRYAAQGRATQPANVLRLFTEELEPDSFSDA